MLLYSETDALCDHNNNEYICQIFISIRKCSGWSHHSRTLKVEMGVGMSCVKDFVKIQLMEEH